MDEMRKGMEEANAMVSKPSWWRILDKVLTISKYGLIVAVFAFKALEYYYRVEVRHFFFSPGGGSLSQPQSKTDTCDNLLSLLRFDAFALSISD